MLINFGGDDSQEFPIKSKLKHIGDPVSAISAEHIGDH